MQPSKYNSTYDTSLLLPLFIQEHENDVVG